jgi:uncharacterized protein
MKVSLFAAWCLFLVAPCWSQTAASDPATKDDVILFFQTMHSHDMIERMIQVQSQAVQQLLHDQFEKEKAVPADFDAQMKKRMDDLIKNMPVDQITQAMIPAYQKHFTHGDIEAMNAFYSSPVGQKVLQELPEVSQEGMQAMMPILSKYLSDWRDRTEQDLKHGTSSTNTQKDPAAKN